MKAETAYWRTFWSILHDAGIEEGTPEAMLVEQPMAMLFWDVANRGYAEGYKAGQESVKEED